MSVFSRIGRRSVSSAAEDTRQLLYESASAIAIQRGMARALPSLEHSSKVTYSFRICVTKEGASLSHTPPRLHIDAITRLPSLAEEHKVIVEALSVQGDIVQKVIVVIFSGRNFCHLCALDTNRYTRSQACPFCYPGQDNSNKMLRYGE